MSKHTPGPWIVSENPFRADEEPQLYVEEAGNNATVAEVVTCIDWAEGNAHLIAAAPELLEMLEAMIKLWDDWGDPKITYTPNNARAAIAKARGENE